MSSMGTFDISNYVNIVIYNTATVNEWTINVNKRQAGSLTNLYSETVTSSIYPWPVLCIEQHTSIFRVWAGLDKNSMSQLGDSFSTALACNRVSIGINTSSDRPNTVFGFNQLIRTTYPLI